MINLIKLFSINAVSTYFYGEKRRIPVFPFVLLLILSIAQINFMNPNEQSTNSTIIGLMLIGVFIFYTLFGLMTTRLPSNIEDIIWVYTSPISIFKISLAVALWQTLMRSILWVGSSLIADLYIFFLKGYFSGILLLSISGMVIFLILEFWIVALSCARFHSFLKVCSVLGFLIFIGILSTYIYQFFTSNASTKMEASILYIPKQLGTLFNGQLTILPIVIVLSILVLSILIMYFSTQNARFKENIVREADFWSEFGDYQSMFNRIHNITEKPSWWGGSFLTGIHSFIWFEWAILRKDKYVHITQTIVMITILWGVARWDDTVLSVVIVLLIVAHILNGFFSGIVKHSLTGDLFLLPGSLIKKIYYLEMVNTLPILGLGSVGLLWGSVYQHYSLWKNLFMIGLISFALIGLRIFIFTQTYTENENLSIQVYFKNSFLVVAAIGMNIFSLFLISSQLTPIILYIFLIGIFFGLISFVMFQKYYVIKYIFSFSLVFCILVYSMKHFTS